MAFGTGGDYSTAVVMDKDKNVMALFRSNRIQPADYGELLFYLGRRFNNALIICERNGPGVPVLNVLHDMGYPNLYHETKITSISKEETTRPGFTTSGQTKPYLISGLARCVREESIQYPSTIMVEELKNYVALENGKMEAADGYHDDTVIALALCVEGLKTHSHRLSMKQNWNRYRNWTPDTETNWL